MTPDNAGAGVRGCRASGRSTKALLSFIMATTIVSLTAAPPSLEHLFPAGGERGSTNEVTLSGKFESWPPEVWVNQPGLEFVAQTNKGKFNVTIAANAAPGPRLIRLFNEEGASELRFFVVGDGRELADREPNNHFAQPQSLDAFPIVINGRLDKSGDVDSFAISMRGGQWLEARVDSFTLMSKVDAVLRLVTTNGLQLTWNHDFVHFDPRLTWQAPEDQTVVLQLFGFPYPADAQIRLTGGEGTVYRLQVNAGERSPEIFCDPRTGNGAAELSVPACVNAVIGKADDEDRFSVHLEAGEMILARVEAATHGSPLDAWLRIEDISGKELARNDDADGSRDPALEWKAPTNGTFAIRIGSLTHRGGEDFRYRLAVERVQPDYSAELSASSLTLTPGSTNDLKLKVKRLRGHTNELTASIRGLPAGVTAADVTVPEKGGDVTLQLIATSDAKPFQGPIRALLHDAVTGEKRAVPFHLTSRSENNGVPGGYTHLVVESTDRSWLTVLPQKEEKKEPDK